MITPHAPQLPAGPGAPLGLPFPVNTLQDPRFPSAEVPVVPHPGFYAALQEEGVQQQLLALAIAQQQGQHINPALIPALMQPHPGGLSVDPTQPGVIFQFPSAEEMARHHHHHQQQQQQKLTQHMAIPEGFALMTQPFPQLAPGISMEAAVAAAAGVRQQDEQQRHPHHVHPPVIQAGTPLFHQMEMHPHHQVLLQQQQQQQLLQHGIRGAVAAMPDDMRREQLQQELLKDPNNPQLLQLAQTHQYMAMMSVEQQQQLQQLQLQEMLFRQQQEMLKQQQQQQQQKFTPAALRPGVIMQPK